MCPFKDYFGKHASDYSLYHQIGGTHYMMRYESLVTPLGGDKMGVKFAASFYIDKNFLGVWHVFIC